MNIEPWSPLAPPPGKHYTSNSPQASKHLSAFGGSNDEWKTIVKNGSEVPRLNSLRLC
jgi:hypothetical protein